MPSPTSRAGGWPGRRAGIASSLADNAYARPIEGLFTVVDLNTMEVLRVEDTSDVPVPPASGAYRADQVGPLRDDVRPLEIVQPEGPSFDVDGHEVRWQKWRFRVGFTPREGLVLHTICLPRPGSLAADLHRASYAELVIPYGDPSPGRFRTNAYDIGEYGIGPMTNSLELGCDCLGEIRYLDAVVHDSRGEPITIAQRDLHARGGRRPALEALRLAGRGLGGAPLAALRDLVDHHRRELRVRASTGTCTRTGRSRPRSS